MKSPERTERTIHISGRIGSVGSILTMPAKPRALIVLAHGAGAGMRHPFLESLSSELAMLSVGSLRFNFPYSEQGRKRPDPPSVAEATVEAALNGAHEFYPGIPLFAGGKSFGGRMASHLLARNHLPFVKGIVFYGFPLHPAGQPGVERARHLVDVDIPLLFLQGTRDALAEIGRMEGVCNSLPTATLVKLPGADHSFRAGKAEFCPALARASADWIESALKREGKRSTDRV